VDYLVERAAVGVADQRERPVGRVTERQQVGAVLVLGETEQFTRKVLVTDRGVAAPDSQACGGERHAHHRLPQVEEDLADLPRIPTHLPFPLHWQFR
jgi:hypothetical protein